MSMIFAAAAMLVMLFPAFVARAGTTNQLSDAEIEGRALAQKILEQQPAQNYTNTGILEIRSDHGHMQVPVEFEVLAGKPAWRSTYSTRITDTNADPSFGRVHFCQLTIVHSGNRSNVYIVPNVNPPPTETNFSHTLDNSEILWPFSGSDFWFCDLGLEFFHWPKQKVIKKEFHRQCPCTVLESINPDPSPSAYSRVDCWIDDDSLGIVEAYAYDANGKKLKNFYPKNLQKVNGQYQVESMVMENLQTGSKSTLEFDLDKSALPASQ
jgi:hypothetical protein